LKDDEGDGGGGGNSEKKIKTKILKLWRDLIIDITI
jgi:hypothetical protein